MPDTSLAEYRKKLHALLHNKDAGNAPKKSVNFHPPSHCPSSFSASSSSSSKERVRVDNRIEELEKSVDMKNRKIVELGKANMEKVQIIKQLNDKVRKLEIENSRKDARIKQLEKVILDLQNLQTQAMGDLTKKIEEELSDNLTFHSDVEDKHQFSIHNLENTKESTQNYTDLHLSTQQLLNLDLGDLVINPPSSVPKDYNLPYVHSDDSDLDQYLFEV